MNLSKDRQYVTCSGFNAFLIKKTLLISSGARGAPWISKFANPSIREILVLVSAYVRTYVRTDFRGGGGES